MRGCRRLIFLLQEPATLVVRVLFPGRDHCLEAMPWEGDPRLAQRLVVRLFLRGSAAVGRFVAVVGFFGGER